jgi:hypothetical protein
MRVWCGLLVLALSASALSLAGCGDGKSQWAVGCTEGVCAAVNNEGEIRYFDLTTKQATGVTKLPTKPVGTVNIDCNSSATGRACAVVDSVGHVWFGPAKPGDPFLDGGFEVGGS